MTLSELVASTGVPASTVHHYLRLGLVPAPQRTATNRFLYDDRHAAAVRAVRYLRERRGLGLEEIAAVLPGVLADTDRSAWLDGWDADGGADAPRRILHAAVEAFRTRDYAEVTVSDVAASAGVAKGSVYRHYSSKEQLFAASVERVLDDTAEAFASVVARLGGPARVTESPEQAAADLALPVAMALPLLIEVGARAAKGHRPSRRLASKVLRTLARAAGQSGAPQTAGEALRAGLAVINAAFAVVVEWALDPSTEPLLPTGPADGTALATVSSSGAPVPHLGRGAAGRAQVPATRVIDMGNHGAYNG